MDGVCRALTFPGQGSQAVGMGKALADWHGAARTVFEEVDDALDERLSALMFDGPAEDLTLTRNAQPALMAAGMAALRVVMAETGRPLAALARYVAGHSLGEYTALAAAGVMSVAEAARLLRLRGEAMQAAVPVGTGAMVALLGASLEQAEAIAGAAAQGQVCDLANDNAPGQVVLSGDRAAVERAAALAPAKGVRKTVMLPVSAPFHCALMAPAAARMAVALAETGLQAPAVPVICNVPARPVREPEAIRRHLVEQVTATVRWRESVEWMAADGVTHLAELGAGRVLSGMARRIDRRLTVMALATPAEIAAFIEAESAAG